MPDWRPYLRERLGPLGLRHEREEERNIWKTSARLKGRKPFCPIGG